MMGNISQSNYAQPGTHLDNYFYGRGKLLITGEYFVLDGAKALALPTNMGQSMSVRYSPSFSPALHWKSFDYNGDLWFESCFEFWRFNTMDETPNDTAVFLQKILRQARKQNVHFLRDEVDVFVETRLGFPLEWGLGSSSTLIYNISQWAYVSPFELLFNTYGGSGYDIACAQSDSAIIYEKKDCGPQWNSFQFNPAFKDKLYFVYLGRKQSTLEGIEHYKKNQSVKKELTVERISTLTDHLVVASDLKNFNAILAEHEAIVGETISKTPIKEQFFSDYWGGVKSLGAWGGDFALVTSDRSAEETRQYFKERGFFTCLGYRELILQGGMISNTTHSASPYIH